MRRLSGSDLGKQSEAHGDQRDVAFTVKQYCDCLSAAPECLPSSLRRPFQLRAPWRLAERASFFSFRSHGRGDATSPTGSPLCAALLLRDSAARRRITRRSLGAEAFSRCRDLPAPHARCRSASISPVRCSGRNGPRQRRGLPTRGCAGHARGRPHPAGCPTALRLEHRSHCPRPVSRLGTKARAVSSADAHVVDVEAGGD